MYKLWGTPTHDDPRFSLGTQYKFINKKSGRLNELMSGLVIEDGKDIATLAYFTVLWKRDKYIYEREMILTMRESWYFFPKDKQSQSVLNLV